MVEYNAFLNRVIDEGMISFKSSPQASDSLKLEGAMAGFDACRGKTPMQLKAILRTAIHQSHYALQNRSKDYWKTRYFEIEVEWVCNVVSAFLTTNVPPQKPICCITSRGIIRAAEVVMLMEKALRA